MTSEFTTHKGLEFKAHFFQCSIECHQDEHGYRYSWKYTIVHGRRQYQQRSHSPSERMTYELCIKYALIDICNSIRKHYRIVDFKDAWKDIRSTFINTCRNNSIDPFRYFPVEWFH